MGDREKRGAQSPDLPVTSSPNRLLQWAARWHAAFLVLLAILALHAFSTMGVYVVSDDLAWVRRAAADAHQPWNAFAQPLFGDYYRPIPELVWTLNYCLWGFDFDGYQLMFILMWLAGVCAVYAVGCRLGGRIAGFAAATLIGLNDQLSAHLELEVLVHDPHRVRGGAGMRLGRVEVARRSAAALRDCGGGPGGDRGALARACAAGALGRGALRAGPARLQGAGRGAAAARCVLADRLGHGHRRRALRAANVSEHADKEAGAGPSGGGRESCDRREAIAGRLRLGAVCPPHAEHLRREPSGVRSRTCAPECPSGQCSAQRVRQGAFTLPVLVRCAARSVRLGAFALPGVVCGAAGGASRKAAAACPGPAISPRPARSVPARHGHAGGALGDRRAGREGAGLLHGECGAGGRGDPDPAFLRGRVRGRPAGPDAGRVVHGELRAGALPGTHLQRLSSARVDRPRALHGAGVAGVRA